MKAGPYVIIAVGGSNDTDLQMNPLSVQHLYEGKVATQFLYFRLTTGKKTSSILLRFDC